VNKNILKASLLLLMVLSFNGTTLADSGDAGFPFGTFHNQSDGDQYTLQIPPLTGATYIDLTAVIKDSSRGLLRNVSARFVVTVPPSINIPYQLEMVLISSNFPPGYYFSTLNRKFILENAGDTVDIGAGEGNDDDLGLSIRFKKQ
jgi:hypothetical protein